MPKWTLLAERARAEDENEADHDQQHLGGEIHDGEKDVDARRLLDADDVERDEQDDHDRAADDVPGVVAQRLPEDGQVMRHEERRDGDRRDVGQICAQAASKLTSSLNPWRAKLEDPPASG